MALDFGPLKTFHNEDLGALRKGVEWDEFEWHYTGDAGNRGVLTCQYIFVLDALNFCFWPTPGFEVMQPARMHATQPTLIAIVPPADSTKTWRVA